MWNVVALPEGKTLHFELSWRVRHMTGEVGWQRPTVQKEPCVVGRQRPPLREQFTDREYSRGRAEIGRREGAES